MASIDSLPEKYLDFTRNSGRLFQARQFPLWKPDSEYPLLEIKLRNDILVDLDLDPNPNYGFMVSAHYLEGSLAQPASHFIEHMLTNPYGIGYLPERLSRTSISYNGSTSVNNTNFQLSVNRLVLLGLHETNPQVLSDLIFLLYGMTATPEITSEVVERERLRMVAELKGREENIESRWYDYLLPLYTLGKHYPSPTSEAQLKFTVEELMKIHAQRQQQEIELEAVGNPQKESAADEIIQAFEETFGRLPRDETYRLDQDLSVELFKYGRKLRVISAYDTVNDYLGLVLIVKDDEDPKKKLAQRSFVAVLTERARELLREISYHSFRYGQEFIRQRYMTQFIGVTTERLAVAYGMFSKLVDDLYSGSYTDEWRKTFEAEVNSSVFDHFKEPNLGRIYFARKLGFPTSDNAVSLYQAFSDLSFEEVMNAGRDLINKRMLGFLHYGPISSITLTGFHQISEADLINVWKQTK